MGLFGRRIGETRKKYRSYVEKGIPMGRRPELVGGGLIRSLGGWDEIKKMRLTGQDRIKGDQRILCSSLLACFEGRLHRGHLDPDTIFILTR